MHGTKPTATSAALYEGNGSPLLMPWWLRAAANAAMVTCLLVQVILLAAWSNGAINEGLVDGMNWGALFTPAWIFYAVLRLGCLQPVLNTPN